MWRRDPAGRVQTCGISACGVGILLAVLRGTRSSVRNNAGGLMLRYRNKKIGKKCLFACLPLYLTFAYVITL